jgi:hypothetical protein
MTFCGSPMWVEEGDRPFRALDVRVVTEARERACRDVQAGQNGLPAAAPVNPQTGLHTCSLPPRNPRAGRPDMALSSQAVRLMTSCIAALAVGVDGRGCGLAA